MTNDKIIELAHIAAKKILDLKVEYGRDLTEQETSACIAHTYWTYQMGITGGWSR